jgi:hypothetical protein
MQERNNKAAVAAIKSGKLSELKRVLALDESLVTQVQKNGSYLLHFAAHTSTEQIFCYLLSKGDKSQLLHKDNQQRSVLDYVLISKSKNSSHLHILNRLLFIIRVPLSVDEICFLRQKKNEILKLAEAIQFSEFEPKFESLLQGIQSNSGWAIERQQQFESYQGVYQDIISFPSLELLTLFALKKTTKPNASFCSLPPHLVETFESLPNTLEDYEKEYGKGWKIA